MVDSHLLNPYAGNILVDRLGPILSREQALAELIDLPPSPGRLKDVPRHVRRHHLMDLRRFHIPPEEEGRLYETCDLMIRSGYSGRDPARPGTWSSISGEAERLKRPSPGAFAAAVQGPSGTGKTEACLRCLNCFPQSILHEDFPHIKGPHCQVTWLSADVPASGKAEDLVRNLMLSWEQINRGGRFTALLQKEKFKNPMQVLDEWRQVALTHFLGVLHLDEVQNFFRITTLDQRRKRKAGDGPAQLSIIEDQCLKWILSLLNTWGIPVLFSGTPDGIGALTTRLSNMQRFATGGYHPFLLFESKDAPDYLAFMKSLGRYQYVRNRVEVNDSLREEVFSLSGGIRRVIVALWIAANRIALERESDELRIGDFKQAADAYLAPLAPAIAAILSRDPLRMARYEDLVSQDSRFWPQFWQRVSTG